MGTSRSRSGNLIGLTCCLIIVLLVLVGCRPAQESSVAPPVSESGEVGTIAPTEPSVYSDPVATTSAFYDWYLAYNDPEQGRNALVDLAYRESEYLSGHLIETVDAQLEQMREEYGGAGFDPFLRAQALPQAFTVESWEVGAEEACVVVHQQFGETTHDLTVDLVLENGAWKMDKIRAASPMTPEGVVTLFLTDYLEQARASLQGGPAGMLQTRAYHESELLSPAFVAKVDDILAESDGPGYDPFLLAQDLPHAINIGEPVVQGERATVNVGRYYAGTPEPTYMAVDLVEEGGRWLINDIRPLVEVEETMGMSPQAVVETFYAEWRETVRAAMAEGGESPLRGGAYHDSPFVAPAFAEEVDAIVAGFEGGEYDPFLCAQDIPNELVVDGAIYTTSGARVALHSSFANHAFVVELAQADDEGWQITGVVCPGTPQSNAAIFYTWYLAYSRDCCVMGATDPGMRRNALVDGAYKNAPYINPAFAAEVETELEEMRAAGGSGYDPILQAQAFPPDFSVQAGEEEGTVIVDMAFANAHRLEVKMEEVDGRWLVSGVSRLEELVTPTPAAAGPDTGDWTTVVDAEHGFSFKIPPGWVAEEQPLQGPGMPDDWPVERHYLVMPAALAEELAARTGPPSGDEAPLVPPLVVSYLYGDQTAFDRVYVSAADTQALDMTGREVLVQRQAGDYAMPRYVFHDEADPQRWLIVEDMVSEFPGREVQAAEIWSVLDGILLTVSLDD